MDFALINQWNNRCLREIFAFAIFAWVGADWLLRQAHQSGTTGGSTGIFQRQVSVTIIVRTLILEGYKLKNLNFASLFKIQIDLYTNALPNSNAILNFYLF